MSFSFAFLFLSRPTSSKLALIFSPQMQQVPRPFELVGRACSQIFKSRSQREVRSERRVVFLARLVDSSALRADFSRVLTFHLQTRRSITFTLSSPSSKTRRRTFLAGGRTRRRLSDRVDVTPRLFRPSRLNFCLGPVLVVLHMDRVHPPNL